MIKSLTSALFVTCMICASPADAGIFDDVWQIVSDPLGLRDASASASNSIDRIVTTLELLQGDFDGDVRDYLSQLRSMISKIDSASANRVRQVEIVLFTLEAEIFSDAQRLLVDTECTVERIVSRTLPEAVYAMLVQLQEANISVDLPIGSLALGVDAVRPLSPDDTYINIRDAYLEVIDGVGETDPAYRVISAYQNISELAFRTYCHYARSGGGQVFLEEHATYASELRPWVQTVRVSVQ